MNSIPCFLLTTFILLFEAGCTSTSFVTSESPATLPTRPTFNQTTPKINPKLSIPEHQELVENSQLGRFARGKIVNNKTQYFCLPSGRFNIATDGANLAMQMNCVEQKPPPDRVAITVEIDVLFPHIEDREGFFQIPFGKSIVSVESIDETQLVKLHYRDQIGMYHHIPLDYRKEKGYTYSLAGIADDSTMPIGHWRFLSTKQ